MKKIKFLTTPTRLNDVYADEIDDHARNDDWRIKAERLQARRWKKLREEM